MTFNAVIPSSQPFFSAGASLFGGDTYSCYTSISLSWIPTCVLLPTTPHRTYPLFSATPLVS
ncbi:hypothetical protein K438DRAFT_1833938, partial [Mycena galopus ATCC 62051]